MTDDAAPTLGDDEATLGRYATELADAVAAVAHVWLTRLVAERAPGIEVQQGVQADLTEAASGAVEELRALLKLDIADQRVGPLEILRRTIAVPTQVLAVAGLPAANRDEFSRSKFPDDAYDLTPASFAAIDPSLHEPGLMWGAAKAHVHMRRRRDAEPMTEPVVSREPQRVVVLSADLMDRSKISAAFPDATLVRSPDKLLQEAANADVVLVDLARLADPAVLSELSARVIAFGSHVNESELAAAESAGAETLPRSVFFRRLESGNI